jgi:hypothetical protein
MEISNARVALKEMKACFAEAGLPIVTETEVLNRPVASDHLMVRSYLSKNERLGEILAFVVPAHGIVQLSLNFYGDVGYAKVPEVLELMNFLNFSSAGAYWTLAESEGRIEFRTAFVVPTGKINHEHFTRVLMNFLASGYEPYCCIWRLIQRDEKTSDLIEELKLKMEKQK